MEAVRHYALKIKFLTCNNMFEKNKNLNIVTHLHVQVTANVIV